MLIDSRQLEPASAIQADLCVIGGGAAGITLAHTLRSSGIAVAVLESGGLAFDDATGWWELRRSPLRTTAWGRKQ